MTAIDNVTGDLRRKIVPYVKSHAGATAEEMSKALGHSASNVSTAARALWIKGVLGRQRDGRWFHYFVPEAVQDEGRDDDRPESPCEIEFEFDFDVAPPTDAVDVAALQAEIETLKQWQADAIAKHPDLAPVDPDLLRAREIAAAAMGDTAAGDIRGGEADHSPLVQAVLMAIRAG